jgi:hypothetical protein
MLRTEPDGRIYPFSRQAAAVVDILRQAASRLGVRTMTGFAVQSIEPESPGGFFCIRATDGRSIAARRIVLASGGLAAPSLGADGSGYALLTRLGHRLVPCFPALVPLRTETSLVHGLAGCKFDGSVSIQVSGRTLESAVGEILFTEYGLSGPPILALSRQVSVRCGRKPPEPVILILDMLPELGVAELRDWLRFRRDSAPDTPIADYLTGLVHKKIGQALIKRCLGLAMNQPMSALGDADVARLAASLKGWPLQALGTRDWHQAQVTAGGLDGRDFRPQDLESRRVPGIFAAGEVLDVDGDCGGFNLQWAWSSGYVAGHQAMQSCLQA